MKTLKLISLFASIIAFNLCEGDPIMNFTGFYPKNCLVNNVDAGIKGTCICIQDVNTKDIWLAVNSEGGMSWDNTSQPLGAAGWIKAINLANTCGMNSGWVLPTTNQLQTLAGHNIDWFNSNGFMGIDPSGSYWGGDEDPTHSSAVYLYMNTGTVNRTGLSYSGPHTYAFAVHIFNN